MPLLAQPWIPMLNYSAGAAFLTCWSCCSHSYLFVCVSDPPFRDHGRDRGCFCDPGRHPRQVWVSLLVVLVMHQAAEVATRAGNPMEPVVAADPKKPAAHQRVAQGEGDQQVDHPIPVAAAHETRAIHRLAQMQVAATQAGHPGEAGSSRLVENRGAEDRAVEDQPVEDQLLDPLV